MDDIKKEEPKRTLGQIKVLPDTSPPQFDIAGRPSPNLVSTIYEWIPAPELMEQLPPGLTFRIRCITGSDGIRRFYPVDNFEAFIGVAFTAGLAVLSVTKEMTPEQRHSYRAMFLLFQRVRRTKEHLRNSLSDATSLRLSRVGRDLADERSILPETVGMDAQGMGRPWSVDRLISEGRKAAREAGIEKPTEAVCVQFGFVAAARLNPLIIPADKIPDLVRQALYDEIPVDEPVEEEVFQAVIERTLAAIQAHLIEPATEFDEWISGGHSSFVAQIGRRKLLLGGRLDQKVVRRALLDLGWRAYEYVAGCIHTVMRVFEQSLPEPLTDAERTCFEQQHLCQRHFGNLPLVLLVERFPLLKDTLWHIFQNPGDQQAIGVLHRLLDWYADLARSRRKTDRKIKERRPAKRLEGEKTPLTVSFEEPAAMAETEEAPESLAWEPAADDENGVFELFEEIVEQVFRGSQLRCKCGLNNWNHRPIASDGITIRIRHTCSSCKDETTSAVSMEQIQKELRA